MTRKLTLLTLTLALLLAACQGTSNSPAALEASGVVEATEISIAAEVPGTVAEVFVEEGATVQAGDPLFRLQNDLLDAQFRQAQAALEAAQTALEAAKTNRGLAQAGLEAAQANVKAAQAGLEAAQAQYDLALLAARAEEQTTRIARWQDAPPSNFNLPNWYFTTDEQIAAAQTELQAAEEALKAEEDNYQSVLASIGEQDVLDAEQRLNDAYAAFRVADALYQREINTQNGKTTLNDYIQNLYDAAKSELDAAQRNYDQVLTNKDRTDLLEARARRDAARERYETALDTLHALQTGTRSPQMRAAEAALAQAQAIVAQAEAGVRQAEAGLAQAEAAIAQAEKGVAQAQAALDALQVQQDKLTVRAPVDGVVTTRSVDLGESVQPGLTAITLAQLDSLSVTVYIPEARYGEISIGQQAEVRVDSFPDEAFSATVSWISDKAEYTPRNVQTKEERVTTVYAIKLRIENAGGKLKPGMPADVT
ncbi:MAG: HlyD family efflux transporter periplasmic adaptor subunit, partial [Anaerolineae bacterium]